MILIATLLTFCAACGLVALVAIIKDPPPIDRFMYYHRIGVIICLLVFVASCFIITYLILIGKV